MISTNFVSKLPGQGRIWMTNDWQHVVAMIILAFWNLINKTYRYIGKAYIYILSASKQLFAENFYVLPYSLCFKT